MPDLRPYLGWGFAGLSRKLDEKITQVEGRVTAIETPAVESGSYAATTLVGILDEIASRLAALEGA